MKETRVGEQESANFLPRIGELMVKRIYIKNSDGNEEESPMQLWDETLYYFIDVDGSNRGNCGRIQHIAKIPFPYKEPDSGNPDFGDFSETTINKSVVEWPSGRIEYSRATTEDLIRFIKLLARFYGGSKKLREDQEEGLKKWFSQVTASSDLLDPEKARLVDACREVLPNAFLNK